MKSKSTTIAIYLPSLRGGGAERVMVTLANAFAERGYAVDLVLASATGPYLSEVSSAVNVANLGRTRVITSLPGLVRYLRKRKPTVLLSAMGHANLVALLAKKLSGGNTRVVVSERTDASVEANQGKGLRSLIIRSLNRYLYRSADAVHAVSQGVAAASAKELGLPLDRIQVVYNPVVTPHMFEMSRANIDFSWLAKDERKIVCAAGRLTKKKDFATLIQAFALVQKKTNARLVIMGEGELRWDLECLIAETSLQQAVLLPGFVENPFAIMKQADLFALTSVFEGLPNVLIQAMACSTPVVSTDCPSGPAEILENGKWGRLVPVGDVEALAKAMLATLMEAEHPDVASRAAYFSVDRAVDGYLRLLFPSKISSAT